MTKQTEQKHSVGVQIPGSMFQLITLSATCLDTSKSQIIRNAIRRWAEDKDISIEDLIYEITVKYQDQWNRKKLELGNDEINKHFVVFIAKCQTELNQKNLDRGIIKTITQGLER